MIVQELIQAKDKDLLASLQAIKRAAELARKTALETNTGIAIFRDNQIIHVSAEQLRDEQQASQAEDAYRTANE